MDYMDYYMDYYGLYMDYIVYKFVLNLPAIKEAGSFQERGESKNPICYKGKYENILEFS